MSGGAREKPKAPSLKPKRAERRYTMSKSTITRAAAVAYAIEHIDNAEVIEVLTKMHEQLTKPRKRSDAPTKTQIMNANLAKAAIEAIKAHGEPVTTKWITEHVNGILTPQKCTAVMKIAIESGEITKEKDGKTITYKAN